MMDFRGFVCNNSVCICLSLFHKASFYWATGDSWRQSVGWVGMWESDSERQETELCVESTGPRCEVLVICVILFLKSQFSVKSVHTWLSRFYHGRRCFDSFQLNPVLGLVEYTRYWSNSDFVNYKPFPSFWLRRRENVRLCVRVICDILQLRVLRAS